MKYKSFLSLVVFGIILFGNVENSNAQFLKKFKDQVSKTVTETIEKVSSKKKKKNAPKVTTPNKNKKSNPVSTNKKNPIKKQNQEIDYSDTYIIKSPHPEFKTIHLQAHKGLLRFGGHNFYYHDKAKSSFIKSKLIRSGYQNYGYILTMRFLDAYYKDIDRTNLTVITHDNVDNKKDRHSSIAQKNLKITVYKLGSESTLKTFFCDASKGNCTSTSNWGGFRDEFEAQEKYAAFIDKHLDNLIKWSKDFFKDGTQTGYYVTQHKWGTSYDFDALGYWTTIFPSNTITTGFNYSFTGDKAFFREFLPITESGNKHLNRMTDPNSYYPLVLLKMNAEAAEALTNKKPEFVYSATKVKIVFKKLNDSNSIPNMEFTYHLLDPVIEFFEDIELTKKIGEINLENVVYKKRN
jgi:Sec-independent protein translocase protein TatA